MRRVGLAELKDSVLAYVEDVEAGETVLVMDRDRVIAELGPPRRQDHDIGARLARGEREGWYTPPEADRHQMLPDRGSPPPDDPDISLEELMREIDRDRAQR